MRQLPSIETGQATRRYERWFVAIIFIILIPIVSDLVSVFFALFGFYIPPGEVQFPFYILAFMFSVLYGRYLVRGLLASPELTLLLVLCVASVLWSVDSRLSMLRSFQIGSVTMLAMTMASALSLNRLIQVLAILGILLMLFSAVALVLVPEARGDEAWPTAWRGLFGHKNGMGANATMTLIMSIGAAMMSRGRARWFFLFGVAISLVMLFGSESRTSQLIAILSVTALLLGGFLRAFPRFLGLGYVLIIVALFTSGILIFSTNLIVLLTDAIDRQPTLSGRLPLWSLVWPVAMEHAWLGYGFEAFWDPQSARVFKLASHPSILYIPYYSHNGLIETILNAGIFGVVLVLGAMIRALVGAFVAARHSAGRLATITATIYLLAFLMFNVTEGLVLNANTALWFASVAIWTKLALLLVRHAPVPHRPPIVDRAGLRTRPKIRTSV